MKRIIHLYILAIVMLVFLLGSCTDKSQSEVGLTLIPPSTITNQVKLDIRGGIRNTTEKDKTYEVSIYWDEESKAALLYSATVSIKAGKSDCVKYILCTQDRVGKHTVILVVEDGVNVYKMQKPTEIIESSIRSTRKIDGAFVGFYHWSEQEGKMWNPTIKTLTDGQWKEVVTSMNKLDMNIVVIQESFRNQQYVSNHNIEQEGYKGKAFYPSELYSDRMPITAHDPIEDVLAQADEEGMYVFMGIGMYAWFDYTKGSLEWHKKVARELWEKYSHHPSFYGFYVSEENMGDLGAFESDSIKKTQKQHETLHFFKELKQYCSEFAPDKPIMFAPNGWGVSEARDKYPILLQYVDIICPFAFARMPENDLTGVEAVNLLQQFCDDADAHLWLDLEAFLFHEKEYYLIPRPIDEIKNDLYLFDNFEKVVCYQYPGVFNDPEMSVCIGEESTIQLFKEYKAYIDSLEQSSNN